MTLKALGVTLGLLGLLSGDAIASPFNEGDGRSNIKNINTEEAIELFVTCETSFPLLSLRWDNRDNAKAAETASTFLNVPSVTPQVIIDRAAECFSTLKSERGMTIVHFDNVQLRCGIGPDINWGHIVVGHFYQRRKNFETKVLQAEMVPIRPSHNTHHARGPVRADLDDLEATSPSSNRQEEVEEDE